MTKFTAAQLKEAQRQIEQLEANIKLQERAAACAMARDDLIAFTKLTMPDPEDPDDATKSRYVAARHHRAIATALENVESGKWRRLIITMPPRHGKSALASNSFPAWFAGRDPYRSIIQATYNENFALDFGRNVRTLMKSNMYKQVFPAVKLRTGSASADRLQTTEGGILAYVGRGGSLTGRGADCLLIDDPIKDREEADSPTVREKLWTWFTQVAMTRLMTGDSRVVIIQCMTGDTPVTMADGTYRRLDQVRAGDEVVAWKDGAPVCRRVLNWAPQGEDEVFELRTGHARVRANARHPFLVQRRDGSREWVRVKDLRPGDDLVVSGKLPGREKGAMTEREAWLLGYMFGDGWVTVRDAKNYDKARDKYYPRRGFVTCVALAAYPEENDRVAAHFDTVLGLRPKPTKYGYSRTDVARVGRWFIERGLTGKAHTKRLPAYLFQEPLDVRMAFLDGFNNADGAVIGKGANKGRWTHGSANEDLIRDIRHLARSCGFAVSNVSVYESVIQAPNSPSPTVSKNVNVQWNPWSQTGDAFRTSRLRKITPAGREVVYDIQVDDAECFLADGLVSHNTRWHEDDLVGRLIDPTNPCYDEQEAAKWRILDLPALALENDPLDREPGAPLWPERFDREYLEGVRRLDSRGFSALYQGRPAPDEGAFFKAEWLKTYKAHELPKDLRYYAAGDFAVSTKQVNDKTCLLPIGVDGDGTIWVLPDVFWKRVETDLTVEAMIDLFQRHQLLRFWGERGQISKSIGPFLRKRMNEAQAFAPIEEMTPAVDKQTRAQSIAARMAMGKVRFPDFAPWWGEAKDEILKFPQGRHDDFVDALAYCGLGLAQQVKAARPLKHEPRAPKTGTLAWVKHASEQEARQRRVKKALAGW